MKRLVPGKREGFTLLELMVSLAVISILMALLLPAVQSAREKARAVQCQTNLKGMATAAMEYETFHRGLPPTSSSAASGATQSPHRHLMPFIDEAIGKKIDIADFSPAFSSPDRTPSSNSDINNGLLRLRIAAIVCPSDDTPPGATSYRANMGSSVQFLKLDNKELREEAAQSGAFVFGRLTRFAEFKDGQSNTALFSERVVGDRAPSGYDSFRDVYANPGVATVDTQTAYSQCRDYATTSPSMSYSFMGCSWLVGGFLHTWYNHVSGPNSSIPDCAGREGALIIDGGRGLFAARSLHPGGVYTAYADGSVRFVNETIGLQIWRSMGSRDLRD